MLYDNGVAFGLSYKSQHLGMSVLTENHDVALLAGSVKFRSFILLLDSLLESQHHGACGINNLYVVVAGQFVGLGRFAVGTEQDLDVVQALHLSVVDSDESHLL